MSDEFVIDRRAKLHEAVDVLLDREPTAAFLSMLEIYAAVLAGKPIWPDQEAKLLEMRREAEAAGVPVEDWARRLGQL
jgi:hypothetical protein